MARKSVVAFLACIALAALVGVVGGLIGGSSRAGPGRDGGSVRIAASAPQTWDPALAGDLGTAAILAQVYEGLTTFDTQDRIQPALAESWTVDEGGRRVVFELRPGIRYSDGTPIAAQDVVDSWLRVIDPERPGPLASLLSDVEGATEHLAGAVGADEVGLEADGDRVTVRLRRPASHFVAVAASPTLAVLPPRARETGGLSPTGDPVVSGAYRPTSVADAAIRLEANERYWAGTAPIPLVEVVTALEGRSPVDVFQAGEVDLVPIGALDASWIRFDRDLGPMLRREESFSVDYYGFDTTEPPFDDPRVRRAFAQAIDRDRLVTLAADGAAPATSLVPPGIAGRSEADLSPRYDPDAARAELEAAGYPSGAGLDAVTLVTLGSPFDAATATELEETLGVEVVVEARPFEEYARMLDDDPPGFWYLAWAADYPSSHAFLGLLLGTGSTNNEGRWSDPAFDTALDAAARSDDPREQRARFTDAERRVRDQAPVIPLSYQPSWALSREGLLGASPSGIGIVRYAGLAWDTP